jgi:hypothetical protein
LTRRFGVPIRLASNQNLDVHFPFIRRHDQTLHLSILIATLDHRIPGRMKFG